MPATLFIISEQNILINLLLLIFSLVVTKKYLNTRDWLVCLSIKNNIQTKKNNIK